MDQVTLAGILGVIFVVVGFLYNRSEKKRRQAEINESIAKSHAEIVRKEVALEKILKEAEELDEKYEDSKSRYRPGDASREWRPGGDSDPSSDPH